MGLGAYGVLVGVYQRRPRAALALIAAMAALSLVLHWAAPARPAPAAEPVGPDEIC